MGRGTGLDGCAVGSHDGSGHSRGCFARLGGRSDRGFFFQMFWGLRQHMQGFTAGDWGMLGVQTSAKSGCNRGADGRHILIEAFVR